MDAKELHNSISDVTRIVAEKRTLDFRPFHHDDEKAVTRLLELAQDAANTLDKAKSLLTQALNGWGANARRDIELDYLARLWAERRALDGVEVTSV